MEKFTTARGGSSWLIRGLATALALGVMSSASPVLFNEPFVASSDALQVLKRSTSQDASCPSSFLCVAEQCPANVICPDGQSCINFEGNLACAPSGTNFCALNPTSFEAVRCDGGICCHGNCYTSDAVCCDNPSVTCQIGTACNVCQPGETCGSGSCSGAPPSTPQPTTAKDSPTPVPTPQPTTPNQPVTTPNTPATTPNSPATTSNQPATPPTTSNQPGTTPTTAPPKPSIVQSDGTLSYIGCYVDSISSRALVVGSDIDSSATGMTVEKCVLLAKTQGMRYAGVEFGSECYFGNTLHTSDKASDGDCSQVCAGNQGEFCGNGNRVQVYQDSTWSDPTVQELTDVLLQYNSSLLELRQLSGQYQNLIQQWSDQQNSTSKRWWPVKRSLTVTQLQEQLTTIEQQYPVIQLLLEQAAANGGVIYLRASSDDVLRPNQPNPFVDAPTLSNAQNAFEIPLQPLRDIQSAIEDDLQSIASAASDNSQTPVLNIARDLDAVTNAEGVIGDIVAGSTVTIIAAGVGVFALIALVFLHFFPSGSSSGSGSSIGNGGSTPTQTTPQPTQTQATTTSSATSTATPTEYLLVAQDGVSVSAFQEYTDTLSSNPEEAIINSPFAIARVVNLTDSEKAQVQSNSLINSVTQNLRTVANPFQYIETREPASSPRLVSETLEKRTQPARGTALINSIIQRVALLFRNRSFADKLGHLSQLSATWFDNSIEPYNGEDYVFEAQPGNGIWIYVLDDGVLYTHSEFANTKTDPEIVIGDYTPTRGHGTEVAGAAVGKNLGVASSANLVSVAFSLLNEADTMLALTNTYNDIVSKNRQGKAVINMSWGWSAPTRDSLNYWMAKAINMFIEIGVVPVCAAGNNGNQALSSELISANVPAAYRGQIDGLIVVGAVDSGGKRTVFTPRCDALDSTSTCATAYAMGEDVTCATNESSYKLDSGTSFASPIVAGLAAYIMAHPNADVQTFVNGGSNGQIASKVSTIIQGWSWSRNASDGLNYPNVAWNGVVANSCNLKTTASAGSTPTGAAKRDNVKRQAATIDTSDVSLTTSATCPLPTATQASFKRRNADSEALDHIASTDARLVCHQARDANGPSADDIKEHLLTNDFLDRICRPDSPKGDMIEISFSNVTMVARVSCAHAAELEVCHSGIKALIDGCIVKQNFFGGIYLQGGTLYTISNVALLG